MRRRKVCNSRKDCSVEFEFSIRGLFLLLLPAAARARSPNLSRAFRGGREERRERQGWVEQVPSVGNFPEVGSVSQTSIRQLGLIS